MKRIHLLFLLFLVVFSCKDKQDDPTVQINDPNANDVIIDSLSQKQLDDLYNIDLPAINYDSIRLPNGMTRAEFIKYLEKNKRTNGANETKTGPQAIKNEIIMKMLDKAETLMNRKNFVKLDESTPDNPHRPAQPNGIAYGYGLADHTVRQNPKGKCYEEVYGLDCSGFLQQMLTNANVTLSNARTSGEQGDIAKWNAFFESDKKYEGLLMKDFGALALANVQSGDIIVWNGHIGIVSGYGVNAYVYNSLGSSAQNCPNDDCIKSEQERNRSVKRGPIGITFAQAVQYMGRSYRILRITTLISGKWQLIGRCSSQDRDAIDFMVEIKPDSRREEEIIKYTTTSEGFDYDGTPYKLAISGEYDSKNNILRGNMSFTFGTETSDTRIDHFEIPLLTDDTGYYRTSKVLDNGGCDIDLRLINRTNENQRVISLTNRASRTSGSLLGSH